MKYARIRTPSGAVRRGRYHGDSVTTGGRTYDLDDPDVATLAPCEPNKLVCVGRNYAAHADEHDADVPDRPLLFLKPPSAVATPGATVRLPPEKTIEHETELAVVIGEQARAIGTSEARDVIAGYTCANDLSNRTDQRREQNWVRGKAFDGSAPLGPCLADPTHVPADASVRCLVNGEERQHGSRDELVFDVPTLLAEITSYLTLQPGDVVLTGTPAGVAPLEDGDTVSCDVEGVGQLTTTVEREIE